MTTKWKCMGFEINELCSSLKSTFCFHSGTALCARTVPSARVMQEYSCSSSENLSKR